MNIEYLFIETAQASIDIEDVGNTCLSIFNDDGEVWYINITTEYGRSTITQFGGNNIEEESINNFYFNTYKIEYNSKKLYSIINKFINDNKKNITQVIEINKEEFLNRLKNNMGKIYD